MNYSVKFMTDLSESIISTLTSLYEHHSQKLFLEKCKKLYNCEISDGYDFNGHYYLNVNETIRHLALTNEEALIKIAIELGLEVPNITYSITEIKYKLDVHNYQNARKYLEEACQKLYSEPATAFELANTALESIIKHICEDEKILSCKDKDTSHKLTEHILKQFNHFPNGLMEENIRNIGSGFITITQAIANIRNNFTKVHGKNSSQFETEEPIYSALAINSVVTLDYF